MNERLKELRKKLNMTQQQFADKLGIKRGAIANYEIGRNIPIDAVISLICREFNVDENWLRTGSGDMFLPCSRTQAITKFAENLTEEPDSFKKRLIEGLAALDEEDWNDLEKIAVKLSSQKKKIKKYVKKQLHPKKVLMRKWKIIDISWNLKKKQRKNHQFYQKTHRKGTTIVGFVIIRKEKKQGCVSFLSTHPCKFANITYLICIWIIITFVSFIFSFQYPYILLK